MTSYESLNQSATDSETEASSCKQQAARKFQVGKHQRREALWFLRTRWFGNLTLDCYLTVADWPLAKLPRDWFVAPMFLPTCADGPAQHPAA